MLKHKQLTKVKHSIAYTIQKYADCIDFSGLSERDVLAFRYLMKDIISLQEHYREYRIQKEVK